MGQYYENNGCVLFPDTVGKTYISPFASIVEKALKASGYTKGNHFVPLSNGEQIINPPMYAAVWGELCKQATKKETIENAQPTTGGQVR